MVIDGYRAGSLEQRGLGAEELAAARPGLVYVTVRCYGSVGPWRSRAGFEPQAETVCGLAHAEGDAERPAKLQWGPLRAITRPGISVRSESWPR